MPFKSLFSQKLRRYYLQPRVFEVNMQVRLYEKFIFLNEKVVAHSQEQAFRKAAEKIERKIEIKGVGSKTLGRAKSFKNT